MAYFDCGINNSVLYVLTKFLTVIFAVIIAIVGSVVIIAISILVFVIGLPLFTLGFLILVPIAYLVRVSISILYLLKAC